MAGLFASAMLLCYIPTSCFAYLHTTRVNLLLQVIESNFFTLVVLATASARATAITDSYGLNCSGPLFPMPPLPMPHLATATLGTEPWSSGRRKLTSCLMGRASDLLALLTALSFGAACWYFAICLYRLRPPPVVSALGKKSVRRVVTRDNGKSSFGNSERATSESEGRKSVQSVFTGDSGEKSVVSVERTSVETDKRGGAQTVFSGDVRHLIVRVDRVAPGNTETPSDEDFGVAGVNAEREATGDLEAAAVGDIEAAAIGDISAAGGEDSERAAVRDIDIAAGVDVVMSAIADSEIAAVSDVEAAAAEDIEKGAGAVVERAALGEIEIAAEVGNIERVLAGDIERITVGDTVRTADGDVGLRKSP
ncbi:unnamed protein product [Closterium sp. NIES-53]